MLCLYRIYQSHLGISVKIKAVYQSNRSLGPIKVTIGANSRLLHIQRKLKKAICLVTISYWIIQKSIEKAITKNEIKELAALTYLQTVRFYTYENFVRSAEILTVIRRDEYCQP